VQSSRSLVTRNGKSAGQKMAIVTFEDLLGSVEGVLFSDCYAQFEHLLKEDAVVFLLGRVDRSRGDPQVIVERIVPIDGVPLQPGTLRLIIDSARLNGNGAAALQSVAGFVHDGAPAPSISGEGDAGVIGPFAGLDASAAFPLEIVVDTGPDRVLLAADSSKRVQLSPKSAETLTRFLGEHCVKVVGGTAVEVTGAGRGNGKKWASRAG
jgi:DNA polymerase-3 subunit alpha